MSIISRRTHFVSSSLRTLITSSFLIQMLFNLVDGPLVPCGNDGHTGNILSFRHTHGQTVDVKSPSGEKSRDLGQNAVFIFYQYGKKSLSCCCSSLFGVIGAVDPVRP